MGGIATSRKIETEAEVEAEEVEAAWKLTTSTSLVGLKVYWFTYENPVTGKSDFGYHDVFFITTAFKLIEQKKIIFFHEFFWI